MRLRTRRTQTITLVMALILSMLLGQQAVASPGGSAVEMQVDPGIGGASFAVDLDTGLVLHQDNADARLLPASTSKLLTALTALRLLNVNEPVTVTESDMVPEEFSRMGLAPGDVATVEQLLYGALVPSGGDAARALARAGGTLLDPEAPDPIAQFVQEMNAVAASLGMVNSGFGNPVGQDDDQSWTTTRDLVRAAAAVLEDPLLSEIVRTPWASVLVSGPNERELIIENSNQFVLFDDAVGVKTGTTDAAGQILVSAFLFGDHTVVTVVMGSGDRYADTSAILDTIRLNWTWLQLGRDSASLGAKEELDAIGLWMPVGQTILVHPDRIPEMRYSIDLDDDSSGIAKGSVRFVLKERVLAILPIYTAGQPGSN